MFPVGFSLDAIGRDATSALPDAPVIDNVDTAPAAARTRVVLAAALRGLATRASRAAERVEPLQLRPRGA